MVSHVSQTLTAQDIINMMVDGVIMDCVIVTKAMLV